VDPVAYNRMCQQNPNAADCGLPLYWPAMTAMISTRSGMHRFSWDMHYGPITADAGGRGGGGGAMGAVPHRTYSGVNAPWAPPGSYAVRLTVDGKSYTQPLTLRLDPRVKTPEAALSQLASLTREMYEGARTAHAAFTAARALAVQLASAQGADADAFRAQVESLAPPAPAGGRGGRGGRGGGGGRGAAAPEGPPTLETVSAALVSAAMSMQAAEVAPTANEVAACAHGRSQLATVMQRWNMLRTTGLSALNAKRKAAGLPAVTLPGH